MKLKSIIIFLTLFLMALPSMVFAKADLVIAVDAPPKSMNPHAFNSDANLSYMSNFFDGLLCCNRRNLFLHRILCPQ